MKRPKLFSVNLHPLSSTNGREGVALWLNSLIKELGFEVEVIAPISRGILAKLTTEGSLGWIVGGELLQRILVTATLLRKVRSVDLIIQHCPGGFSLQQGLRVFHNNPLEYTERLKGVCLLRWIRSYIFTLPIERLCAIGPTKNIAVSHHQAKYLARLGIRVDKVIYPPVATSYFSYSHDKIDRGISPHNSNPVILSVIRESYGKNLAAIIKLANRLKDCKFHVIGIEPIKAKGIPKNCKFIPRCNKDELRSHLECADLFLSLSLSESFGLSLAEALVSGLPFVSSRTGLASDLVDWDPLFSAVTLDSPFDDPTDKVLQVLSDSALHMKIATKGRDFVLANASETVVAAQYKELLMELIGKHYPKQDSEQRNGDSAWS